MSALNAQSWGSKPSGIRVLPIHATVRGRVRLKVSGLYRTPEMGARLVAAIQRQPVVRGAQANAFTGNLLVVHDGTLGVDEVVDLVRQVVAHVLSAPVTEENAIRHVAQDALTASSSSGSLWHVLHPEVCLIQCETTSDAGLSSSVAAARLAQWGRNALPQPVARSALALFLEQFKTLPVAMLGISAVVSLATGGLADAAVILAVVLINATIGYVTESQAERIIGALNVTPRHRVRVLRDGRVYDVEPETVVIGDILVLAPGEAVAADGRLIEVQGLSVDEAALTGESMPVNKITTALARRDAPLGDRANMVYMGTTVTGGSGRAVIVATGLATEIGHVHALLGSATAPETPMQRQLSDMGRQLVLASGAICGVVFGMGMLRGYGLARMLKTSISLAVAAVPEGLPAVATTTLSLGIRDMRRHGVLIRHLAAVETLGSVQVICMDKTGTLTINRMSAVVLHTGTTAVTVSRRGFLCGEHSLEPLNHPDLGPLLQVAVLCNDTELVGVGADWSLHGSATENALIAVALAAGMDVTALRNLRPRLRVHYRTETRRYMVTEHLMPDGHLWMAVKGSPAEVLALCRWYIKDGERYFLDEAQRTAIETANERAAGGALRMLGLAYGEALEDNEALPLDLVWLGMVGMMDPIREGVPDLIASFHQAGIDTVMITGDQSATAYAIGRELDLGGGQSIEIFDSSRLDQVDDALLSALAQRVQVFARVSPAHKLKIVQALQRAGKVVAMTGDGINDSPALKAADIGVAMGGDGGTQAARDVADVVLEADDLQTMLLTVSRGRTIYSNIRKSIHYLLATNMSEIMVMSTAIATGMGQPLNPMQLLWINLLSDIFPGLALAVEPPEPDVLQRPPRDPKEPIVGWGDFKRLGLEAGVLSAGSLASYGYGRLRYGPGAQANTMAFMSLSTAQILHALSCRSERHNLLHPDHMEPNPYLTLAVGGSVAVQTLAALAPGLRSFLGLVPLGLVDVLVVGGGAVGPLLINELTKGSRTLRRAEKGV